MTGLVPGMDPVPTVLERFPETPDELRAHGLLNQPRVPAGSRRPRRLLLVGAGVAAVLAAGIGIGVAVTDGGHTTSTTAAARSAATEPANLAPSSNATAATPAPPVTHRSEPPSRVVKPKQTKTVQPRTGSTAPKPAPPAAAIPIASAVAPPPVAHAPTSQAAPVAAPASVSFRCPSAVGLTVTASGAGTVNLQLVGPGLFRSASGQGAAVVTASGGPGSYTATASGSGGSVAVHWSSTGAERCS